MICPKCKKEFNGYPAISRRDNKTKICSDCGTREALKDYGLNNETAEALIGQAKSLNYRAGGKIDDNIKIKKVEK